MNYIHQQKHWPNFDFDTNQISPIIEQIEALDFKLKTIMSLVGIEKINQLDLETTITEIVKNFEIESVRLNSDDVRSSILKKLGLNEALLPTNRNIDGYVDASLDAIKNSDKTLSHERLLAWHSSLFHTGKNEHGLQVIPGKYRDLSDGKMMVTSGNLGRETIHYLAPEGELIENEMNLFVQWFNKDLDLKPVVKSAIAHLWFISIHPFVDGNGRISRIISDMAISKSNNFLKYYSISEQIQSNKKEYYSILERTQKGDSLDITAFIYWFAQQTYKALLSTEKRIENIVLQVKFWDKNRSANLNTRQVSYLDQILKQEVFNKVNTKKYSEAFGISKETASRDLIDLFKKGIVEKLPAGGRETAYYIQEMGLPDEKEFGKGKQRGV